MYLTLVHNYGAYCEYTCPSNQTLELKQSKLHSLLHSLHSLLHREDTHHIFEVDSFDLGQ